jgi:hypothetical protein
VGNSSAQETFRSPYNEALKDFLTAYLDENAEGSINTIYILKNNLTDSILNSIEYKSKRVAVVLVTNSQLLRGKIKSVLEIVPIQMIEGKLRFGIIHFGVEINRRKIKFVNSLSGLDYILSFNCDTGNYDVARME